MRQLRFVVGCVLVLALPLGAPAQKDKDKDNKEPPKKEKDKSKEKKVTPIDGKLLLGAWAPAGKDNITIEFIKGGKYTATETVKDRSKQKKKTVVEAAWAL